MRNYQLPKILYGKIQRSNRNADSLYDYHLCLETDHVLPAAGLAWPKTGDSPRASPLAGLRTFGPGYSLPWHQKNCSRLVVADSRMSQIWRLYVLKSTIDLHGVSRDDVLPSCVCVCGMTGESVELILSAARQEVVFRNKHVRFDLRNKILFTQWRNNEASRTKINPFYFSTRNHIIL